MSTAISFANTARNQYVPRGLNELHTIFERHFADFCEHYEEKYAATYGRYRLERIQQLGERFSTCGDYLLGIARIRCTNPECGLVSGVRRLLGHASWTRLLSSVLLQGILSMPILQSKAHDPLCRAFDKRSPSQAAPSPIRLHDAEGTPAVLPCLVGR